MKMQIPPHDFEKLSAYLDGQLSPRQRNHLEIRLKKEAELQSALEDLRNTRALVRATPRQRTPRNFTLTPEMVRQPRSVNPRLFSTFRLASALATLLFVVVVVGDVFGIQESVNREAPQILAVQEKEVAPQMEAVEAPPAEAIEEPLMAAPAPGAFDIQAEITAVPETEVDETLRSMPTEGQVEAEEFGEDMLEAAPSSEGEAASGEVPLLKEALPPEEGIGVVEASPEVTKMAEALSGTKVTGTQTSEIEENNSLEETPQELEPENIATAVEVVLVSEAKWSLLHLIELILGIIALGTGGMAFYFRRQV
jgi:hypothetical protein